MHRKMVRFLSLFLSAAMMAGSLSLPALAEEVPAVYAETAEEAAEEEEQETASEEEAVPAEEPAVEENTEEAAEETTEEAEAADEAVDQETPEDPSEETDAAEASEESADEAVDETSDETSQETETEPFDEAAEDETAAPAETVEETPAPVEEVTTDKVMDGTAEEQEVPVTGEAYVLMNIPYSEFYAAEGTDDVDAVSSSTKSKTRNKNLAGGSYHVNADGSDISGITYPVYVEDISVLEGLTSVTAEDDLFEAPDYSYCILSEEPAQSKKLTVGENGGFSFGAVNGEAVTVEGAAGDVTIGGRHTDVEIKLSNTTGIDSSTKVSGVVLTDTEGGRYGMRHVYNIWRGTELGWNFGEYDLVGKTISNIRYITKDAVIDYPVEIEIAYNAGYVLMNIPYAKFYEAEGTADVDAVSSSTKSKTRNSLAAGSYHVNADGSDISGIIFPVYVEDLSVMENMTQITDESSVDITVTNRGTTTTTTYAGKDALFEAPDYAYYLLNSGRPSRFKTLSVGEDGTFSFSKVNGRAATVEGVTGEVTYNGRHTDIEIPLDGTTGIEQGDTVSAVVLTDADGNKYGMRHVYNIWRATELGWNDDELDLYGKTITNIRYITQSAVIDFPVTISLKNKLSGVEAAFKDAKTINVTGIPEDAENAKATVSSVVGRGETAVVIAENADIADGVITTTDPAVPGTKYNVKVISDNYADAAAQAEFGKAASTVQLTEKTAAYTGSAIDIDAAKVTGSTGKVTYTYYSDEACTKEVTEHVNAGTYYVKASVEADADYEAASSDAVKLTISRADQTITARAAAATVSVGKTTKVTGSGAKESSKYTFKSSNPAVAAVNASGTVTGIKAGTAVITVTAAQTANYNAASATVKITVSMPLKKPGNCHFVKWNKANYTSCQIAWNKAAGADGYETLLSWTNGSHASRKILNARTLSQNCTVVENHVSQFQVRAFYNGVNGRVYGPWSNVEYITPSPSKLTYKNVSKGSDLKAKVSWNIIYGCNGYNVFVTTNPKGTWYWNQSTSTNAAATSATITKYRGSKLKKNTKYYVRIVTRRKRNGVFCTVPMPSSSTYVGSFVIK